MALRKATCLKCEQLSGFSNLRAPENILQPTLWLGWEGVRSGQAHPSLHAVLYWPCLPGNLCPGASATLFVFFPVSHFLPFLQMTWLSTFVPSALVVEVDFVWIAMVTVLMGNWDPR